MVKNPGDIKVNIFPPQDNSKVFICGIQWDDWGIKGEGSTVTTAVEDAVRNFYAEFVHGVRQP